jgi:hypothetical protein
MHKISWLFQQKLLNLSNDPLIFSHLFCSLHLVICMRNQMVKFTLLFTFGLLPGEIFRVFPSCDLFFRDLLHPLAPSLDFQQRRTFLRCCVVGLDIPSKCPIQSRTSEPCLLLLSPKHPKSTSSPLHHNLFHPLHLQVMSLSLSSKRQRLVSSELNDQADLLSVRAL